MNFRTPILAVLALTLAQAIAACAAKPPPPPPVDNTPKVVVKEPTGEELLEEGKKLFDGGDMPNAIVKLDLAANKLGRNTEAYRLLARAHLAMGKKEEAISKYQRVNSLDPKDQEAILQMALIYNDLGRSKDAESWVEKGLINDPYNTRLLNIKARAQRRSGKLDEAIESVRRILSREPDNMDAYKTLSLVYIQKKDYLMAEHAIIQARKYDVNDASLLNNLGMIHTGKWQKTGDYKDYRLAIERFLEAVRLDPKFVEPRINLAAFAIKYRDYDVARQHYEAILQVDKNNAVAKEYLPLCYLGLQDYAKAATLLEERLKEQGTRRDPMTVYYAANAYEYVVGGDAKTNMIKARNYYKEYAALVSDPKARKEGQDKVSELEAKIEGLDMAAKAAADAEAARKKEEEAARKAKAAGLTLEGLAEQAGDQPAAAATPTDSAVPPAGGSAPAAAPSPAPEEKKPEPAPAGSPAGAAPAETPPAAKPADGGAAPADPSAVPAGAAAPAAAPEEKKPDTASASPTGGASP
ncbi:MAG: Lipopolysaccharide assembly protein B [Myxococcota bacterium]|nr:Lipopolysaccharide assembly protein B [Myxococcota bacterium]